MHRHVPFRDYPDRSSKRCFQLRGPLRHDRRQERFAWIFQQAAAADLWNESYGGLVSRIRRIISSGGAMRLTSRGYPRGIDRSIPPITLNADWDGCETSERCVQRCWYVALEIIYTFLADCVLLLGNWTAIDFTSVNHLT